MFLACQIEPAFVIFLLKLVRIGGIARAPGVSKCWLVYIAELNTQVFFRKFHAYEWCKRPIGERRVANDMRRASSTRCSSSVAAFARPITRRENRSKITARYSQTSAVSTALVSMTHFWLGKLAATS